MLILHKGVLSQAYKIKVDNSNIDVLFADSNGEYITIVKLDTPEQAQDVFERIINDLYTQNLIETKNYKKIS